MSKLAGTDEYVGNCNQQRATCAEAAVKAYVAAKEQNTTDLFDFSSEPPQDRLADLLADLRHWAQQNDLDFDEANRVGEMHFEAEVDEEQ